MYLEKSGLLEDIIDKDLFKIENFLDIFEIYKFI